LRSSQLGVNFVGWVVVAFTLLRVLLAILVAMLTSMIKVFVEVAMVVKAVYLHRHR
jgi:hypothetical protein